MKIRTITIAVLALMLSACGNTASDNVQQSSAAAEETPAAVKEEKEVSYTSDIIQFNVETNSIGTAELNAIVGITNTGTTNLYIGANNKFAVNDAEGHLISSENLLNVCRNIIAPGETGYVYTWYASLPDGTDTSQEFTLEPELDVEEAYGEGITDYEVEDIGLSTDSLGYPDITGRLINTSDEEISYLYINAILRDESGNIIGITGTSVMEVEPGAQTTFQISTLDDYGGRTAGAEVVARKDHYQF